MTVRFLTLVSLLSCALSCFGQNGTEFRDWRPISGEVSVRPTIACESLTALTNYNFSVVSARSVPASETTPQHCQVRGLIAPEIAFEVAMPQAWNGRLYMFGNGGFAGESLDYPLHVRQTANALKHGFAVTYTNTGHDEAVEPLASFAANRQKLIDFAFRSVHLTVVTAKTVIRGYYGKQASHAYFDGCSTGGRQGLTEAQRFPDDFDGIVVGAAMLDYVGTMISSVWIGRALNTAPIPSKKLQVLSDHIYSRCDALDGLKDGLIDDPRKCDFKPSRDLPVCKGRDDTPSCFTPKQIAALEKVYADVVSNGKTIFPGWPVGGEIDGPNWFSKTGHNSGWVPMLINDEGTSWATMYTQAFFRTFALPDSSPQYELAQFDFDQDPIRMVSVRQLMDATNPDLSRFKSHGGKLLMYWGWGDPALNPKMGVDYYEQVSTHMGSSTTDFFRLFMVPGMFHCGGGVGPSEFDAMTTMIRWAESNQAPDQMIGTHAESGKQGFTRPLCPFPKVAKYEGTGNNNDAGSFACQMP